MKFLDGLFMETRSHTKDQGPTSRLLTRYFDGVTRMMMLVLTDENVQSGEIMAQDKPRQVQSTTVSLELADREKDSFGSNPVFPKDGGQRSSQWISAMRRLFDTRGGGKASCMGSIASSRFFKFLVVGGIGVVVNLLMMALLIQVGYARDWRASAIASAVAALHNYLLNNHWTFSDRRRNGRALLNGAFTYIPMAAVGIAITTVSYSILSQARLRNNFGTSSIYLLGAQLVSILFGTYLNYTLNKFFTWRLGRDQLQ
jgi:putative flippase GtrA